MPSDREIVVSRVIEAPRDRVIDRPNRIEFRHGEFPDDPSAFDSVVTFTREA
ncbi:MAG: hypothetical protein ACTII7_03685 [Galactobacter sp.]